MNKPRHTPCDIETYHARSEWSNSQISDFLNHGPLYFHGMHFCKPALNKRPEKKCWNFGSTVHGLLSEPGAVDTFCRAIPLDVLSKSGARSGAAYDAWVAENSDVIHLKQKEIDAARAMVRRVYKNETAAALLAAALHYEHTMVWTDEKTGLDLRCRPDIVTGIGNTIILSDAKSTRELDPMRFRYAVRDFGYHRQGAFYQRPFKLLGYDLGPFCFLAMNNKWPYQTHVYELPQWIIDEADEEIDEALADIAARIEAHGDLPLEDETAWMTDLDQGSVVIEVPQKRIETYS
jgi:hypothetical protein